MVVILVCECDLGLELMLADRLIHASSGVYFKLV